MHVRATTGQSEALFLNFLVAVHLLVMLRRSQREALSAHTQIGHTNLRFVKPTHLRCDCRAPWEQVGARKVRG